MPDEYYVCARNRDEHGSVYNGAVLWFRPDGKGYTSNVAEAGVFTSDSPYWADREKGVRFVPRKIVDAHVEHMSLAWWNDISAAIKKEQEAHHA